MSYIYIQFIRVMSCAAPCAISNPDLYMPQLSILPLTAGRRLLKKKEGDDCLHTHGQSKTPNPKTRKKWPSLVCLQAELFTIGSLIRGY